MIQQGPIIDQKVYRCSHWLHSNHFLLLIKFCDILASYLILLDFNILTIQILLFNGTEELKGIYKMFNVFQNVAALKDYDQFSMMCSSKNTGVLITSDFLLLRVQREFSERGGQMDTLLSRVYQTDLCSRINYMLVWDTSVSEREKTIEKNLRIMKHFLRFFNKQKKRDVITLVSTVAICLVQSF